MLHAAVRIRNWFRFCKRKSVRMQQGKEEEEEEEEEEGEGEGVPDADRKTVSNKADATIASDIRSAWTSTGCASGRRWTSLRRLATRATACDALLRSS